MQFIYRSKIRHFRLKIKEPFLLEDTWRNITLVREQEKNIAVVKSKLEAWTSNNGPRNSWKLRQFWTNIFERTLKICLYTHWEKFCNINDTLKRVTGILVNGHISTGILTRIPLAILVKIAVEMSQFTRILVTRFTVSPMLQNFHQCSVHCTIEAKTLVAGVLV